MYKRGEIILVPIPFSDLSWIKKRPVLVVSNVFHNNTSKDIIVVAITSNLQHKGIIIETTDVSVGKLPKTSVICCEKIYTIRQSIVIKRFGVVSKNILNNVIKEINILITE